MYSEGRTCLICGSLIGDSNSSGIGGECKYSYDKATRCVYLDNEQRRKEYYNFKSSELLTLFVSTFNNTKFRSEFKKSFFNSMLEAKKNNNNLSTKQQAICINMLQDKLNYDFMLEIDKKDENYKSQLLWRYKPSKEEKEKIVNLANKFRHEFRQLNKRG